MNALNHIAFIMDGNGRWGKKKKKSRNFGHSQGVEIVKNVVKNCISLKIPFVTFYVFSSENWRRPKKEISFLFRLIKNYFSKELQSVISQGIKINIIGETDKLPLDLRVVLKKSIIQTKKNNKITVNLAINYGSKKEIIHASNKTRGKINLKNFEKNLYTYKIPDPDILIRTGGQTRLSNFMLWQLAYTELFFLNKLWPEFNRNDLKKIIYKYKKIKRNYGSI